MSVLFLPFFVHEKLLTSEFLQDPLYFFLSLCSFPVSDALFNLLAQFFLVVFVYFHSVSLLLNEPSDLIVSFIGLFMFIFLRPRHNFGSICFFFGCCCCGVCVITTICMLLLLQQRVCSQLALFQQLRRSCLHPNGVLLRLPSPPSACSNSMAAAFASSFEWCAASRSRLQCSCGVCVFVSVG